MIHLTRSMYSKVLRNLPPILRLSLMVTIIVIIADSVTAISITELKSMSSIFRSLTQTARKVRKECRG